MPFWKTGVFAKKRLYADAAAGTPLSARSKNELIRLLELYCNAGALHKEGVEAKKEIERARASVAASVGAHADEIIFTASGTEANNLALEGALRPLLRERGEVHAVTCAIEHPSVLEPLRAMEREGLYTTVLPVSSEGLIDVNELREAINGETALVSIQLVNSEIGTIEPIREIAKLLRAQSKKILLHVDASQAPLWMDIKVDALHADLLTLDAQKVLGPKGVGALYARRATALEPIIWGGSQEGGYRAGTQNTPLIGAFAVALEDAQRGVGERAQKVAEVRDYCFAEIKKLIPEAILNGPNGNTRVANNLNVSIPGLEAQMAVIALDAEAIAASTRSACSAGEEEPSHVIKAIGVPDNLAGTAIRITFLPDITKAQALRIAKTLFEIAQRYKK